MSKPFTMSGWTIDQLPPAPSGINAGQLEVFPDNPVALGSTILGFPQQMVSFATTDPAATANLSFPDLANIAYSIGGGNWIVNWGSARVPAALSLNGPPSENVTFQLGFNPSSSDQTIALWVGDAQVDSTQAPGFGPEPTLTAPSSALASGDNQLFFVLPPGELSAITVLGSAELQTQSVSFDAIQPVPTANLSFPHLANLLYWGDGWANFAGGALVDAVLTLNNAPDVEFALDYETTQEQGSLSIYVGGLQVAYAAVAGAQSRQTTNLTVPGSVLSAGTNSLQFGLDPGTLYSITLIGQPPGGVPVQASYYWKMQDFFTQGANTSRGYSTAISSGTSDTNVFTNQFCENIGIDIKAEAGAIFEKATFALSLGFSATQTYAHAITITELTTISRSIGVKTTEETSYEYWQLVMCYEIPDQDDAHLDDNTCVTILTQYPPSA